MPVYVYECPVCEVEFLDFQHKYIGTRIIFCPNYCIIGGSLRPARLQRNYKKEFDNIGIIGDWEPGYNVGIDEHYTSKKDLMEKIKRKGLRPMYNDSSRSSGGLYGDEENKEVMGYSEPLPDYGEGEVEWVEAESGVPPGED